MAIFKNISKKIISVNGVAVMPDESTEIPNSFTELPSIKALEAAGRAIVTESRKPAPKPVAKPVPAETVAEEPAEETVEKVVEEAPKAKRRTKKKEEEKTEEEESKAAEEELAKKIFG